MLSAAGSRDKRRHMQALPASRPMPARQLDRSDGLCKEGGQLPLSIQGIEIITTANMLAIDENLRHRGPPTSPLTHEGAQFAVSHDVDFSVIDTLVIQQPFGAMTIRAKHRRVDLNLSHDDISDSNRSESSSLTFGN